MKKKIAIITLYYKSSNYGGLLQAYALQKALTNFGDAYQISYDMESGYAYDSNLHRMISKVKKPIKNLLNLSWTLKQYKKKTKTRNFAKKIPHTKVVTSKTIDSLANQFDIFVCGSDQIWNPIGWQPSFFLDFVKDNKIKISYAASVARDYLSDEELNYMNKFLVEFDEISVREKKSAEILMNYREDIKVDVMPDPTFLIDRNEWEFLAEKKYSNDAPYIFAYFLGDNINHRNSIVRFAKKRNMKLLYVPYLSKDLFEWDKKHSDNLTGAISVEEFLGLIKNADFVLTDSFHGAVFSLIFNKSFYVLDRFAATDSKSMNSRIHTLLDIFNLEHRASQDLDEFEKIYFDNNTLDFINAKIKDLRSSGISFLKKSLESKSN